MYKYCYSNKGAIYAKGLCCDMLSWHDAIVWPGLYILTKQLFCVSTK